MDGAGMARRRLAAASQDGGPLDGGAPFVPFGRVRGAAAWQERLAALSAAVRLSAPVVLLESCRVDVPLVVGWFRPVILIPLGLLAGMPPEHVEAILLHELAHIRRRDYLVNLLQAVAENLLFYHPAVWWISGVIRAERENCCDDLVVAVRGNAYDYAVALTSLEENRWTGEPALAATGGNLMKRIHRLLDNPEPRHAAVTPAFSASVILVAAAVAISRMAAETGGASAGHPRAGHDDSLPELAGPGRGVHHHRRGARRVPATDYRRGARALHRAVLASARSDAGHPGERNEGRALPAHRICQ